MRRLADRARQTGRAEPRPSVSIRESLPAPGIAAGYYWGRNMEAAITAAAAAATTKQQ